MDLDLDKINLRGKSGVVPAVVSSRALTDEDLDQLAKRETNSGSALKRLTARHRRLARLLVEGKSVTQASALTGLSVSRISILKGDATFQDLMSQETAMLTDIYQDVHEGLANLNLDAINELAERLEDAPGEIETSTLLDIVKLAADRTGHAPKRTEEKNININFGDRLEQARQRQLAASKVVELEAKEIVNE